MDTRSPSTSLAAAKRKPINLEHVEDLVQALGDALEDASTDDTTPAEVISAVFSTLHRLLAAMRHFEDPLDHDHNTIEVQRVMTHILKEHGLLLQ